MAAYRAMEKDRVALSKEAQKASEAKKVLKDKKVRLAEGIRCNKEAARGLLRAEREFENKLQEMERIIQVTDPVYQWRTAVWHQFCSSLAISDLDTTICSPVQITAQLYVECRSNLDHVVEAESRLREAFEAAEAKLDKVEKAIESKTNQMSKERSKLLHTRNSLVCSKCHRFPKLQIRSVDLEDKGDDQEEFMYPRTDGDGGDISDGDCSPGPWPSKLQGQLEHELWQP